MRYIVSSSHLPQALKIVSLSHFCPHVRWNLIPSSNWIRENNRVKASVNKIMNWRPRGDLESEIQPVLSSPRMTTERTVPTPVVV